MNVYQTKIYYHDTDCGSVVYYGNYLKHLEEARTEFMLAKGIDIRQLSNEGIYFVVASVNVKYKTPARYLDTISITTEVKAVKMSMIVLAHTITRDTEQILTAEVTLMCVGANFKPLNVRPEIKARLLA